jgi:hypothetical protein
MRTTKLVLISTLLAFAFGLTQACNRDSHNNDIEEIFNVDSKVELLFFYKKESSQQARKTFFEYVLNRPHPGGGYWPRDGIKATFGIDRNGYEGYGFKFLPDATPEQRQEIKQLLQKSDLVHKVYENVAPNEINDL